VAAETTAPTMAGTGSIEALKKVKATEVEWDGRLAAARGETEKLLLQLRDESAAAVKAAELAAERDRTARVEQARVETAAAAAAILADGEKAAAKAERAEGRRPADKRDAVLDAVLGAFGKE